MANKLGNILGNDTKSTSNVDAISDKIAQSVVKILLSSNKIDALNLKEKKDLSGGRKIGNIDTARYTTISENQNVRMRKGDGVANVLSRLYGLLKGSHDEDVKQMELTRNFKEEKLKEGRKYSKVTHQTFGKKRRRPRTKTGLAGLAVLGLISSMGSIMDWMENFTAEGGGLDQLMSSFSNMINDPDGIIQKFVKGGVDLFDTFKDITSNEMDKQSATWENFKKDMSFTATAISDMYDNMKNVFTEIFTKVKEFFTNISPLDIFDPSKWLEFLKIVPNAFSNMFDKNSSVLDEYHKQQETLPKEPEPERGDFFKKAADPKNKDKGVVGSAIKTAIKASSEINQSANKNMPQTQVAKLGTQIDPNTTATSSMIKLSKKDVVTPTTQAFSKSSSYITEGLQNYVENNKSDSDNYSMKLPNNSMYLLSDPEYHPPVRIPKLKTKSENPTVITKNNNNSTAVPGGKPAGSSGPGVNATCRNDNKTLSKINMGCVVGP